METDYTKITIHPLLEPIKRLFEFYILGIGFIGTPLFQREILKVHPGMFSLIDAYNKEVNLRIDGPQVKSSTKLYLTNIGRFMAIAIFDFLQFSKYQGYLNKTEIFKFAKHIRNGAAHNNKFTFDLKSKQELLNRKIMWRDKTINISLQGKIVIPNFINPNMLIFLMSDISDLISKFEDKRRL